MHSLLILALQRAFVRQEIRKEADLVLDLIPPGIQGPNRSDGRPGLIYRANKDNEGDDSSAPGRKTGRKGKGKASKDRPLAEPKTFWDRFQVYQNNIIESHQNDTGCTAFEK